MNAASALLTEILTPDLYRHNAFRVLGLPNTASTRAIATQVQKRKVLAELGSTDPSLDGPFPLKLPPDSEALRKAEQALHDPLRRIIHELFWFWPIDGIDGGNDPGYIALKNGNVTEATRIWNEAASNPGTATVARHNNAVRHHLTALGLENRDPKFREEPQAQERYLRYWKSSIGLWDRLIADDVMWSALSARAIALADDRLSLDFIQELRRRVPEAIASINSTLVANYVSEGRADLAKPHISIFTDGKLSSINVSTFARATIDYLKGNLRSFLRANDPGIQGREASGADIAGTLIGALGAYCNCLEELEPAAKDASWRDTVDELIRRANQYAVAYVEQTHENAHFLAILRSALAYVSQNELFLVLDKNIKSAVEAIAGTYLQPCFETLKQVQESKESPKVRLDALSVNVTSRFEEIRHKLGELAYPIDDLTNAIAAVLRDIAIDAWNQNKDATIAKSALDRALQFAVDNELIERIKSDGTTLQGLAVAAERTSKDRRRKRLWGAVASVAGLLLIIYLANSNPDGSGSSGTPEQQGASAPVEPPQLSTPAAGDSQVAPTDEGSVNAGSGNEYLVPHTHDAELDRDNQEMEEAQAARRRLKLQVETDDARLERTQAAITSLKAQAEALGTSIDAERPLVQDADPASVGGFNSEVRRYNQMIENLRRLDAQANEEVHVHNKLVEAFHTQTATYNRLVKSYNATLARYGTKQ